MKVKVKAKNIEIDIPKKEDVEEEFDPVRKGKVSFFNESKGYGFVPDTETNEKHFMHISGIIDDIIENDKVTFELEKGQRGMNAVKVKKV
jgi:cold shock CspA family protein